MAANNVVLELQEVVIRHAVLRHWSESSVDAVDDFVGGKVSKESVALVYCGKLVRGECEVFALEDDLFYVVECYHSIVFIKVAKIQNLL